MTPIINPEPGRFICRGPSAMHNAMVLEGFERDRGLKVAVLDRSSIVTSFDVRHTANRMRQQLIADADVIIDVIP